MWSTSALAVVVVDLLILAGTTPMEVAAGVVKCE
jgi:hypothetical protein